MKRPASYLTALGVAAAIGVTCFFAGGVTARQQLDASYSAKEAALPERIKIQKIETETIKRVEIYAQPETCARANALAIEAAEAFAGYDAEYAQLRGIQDYLGSAIVLKNMTNLNKAKQELFDYSSDSADVVRDLAQAVNLLKIENEACIRDLNR